MPSRDIYTVIKSRLGEISYIEIVSLLEYIYSL